MRPSPVRQRSAPCSAAPRPRASATSPTPRSSRAPQTLGQRPAQAAGRAGAGQLAQLAPGGGGQRVGQPGQHAVQERDVGRRRALLRPVDRRRAVRPEQRVVDVAGDGQVHRLRGCAPSPGAGPQPAIEARQVDPLQPRQRLGVRRELRPAGVEEARPQRRQRARTAVAGCAAADAQHDPAGAAVERVAQQLAGPARGRSARPARTGQREARGGGHLDHRQLALRGRRPPRPARRAVPRRAVRARRAPPARKAATVPSPPSAIGTRLHSTSGTTSRSPAASAAATAAASRLPLNLSGATTTRTRRYDLVSGMSTVIVSPAETLPL